MTAESPERSTPSHAIAESFVARSPRQGLQEHAPAPRAMRKRRQGLRARGFTLPEFMMALGIAAILVAIGAPSLATMVAGQRVKTATVDVYTSLAYARSEAIKRNSVVTITPRSGDFANGYDLEAGGQVLKSQAGSLAVAIAAPSGVPLAFDGSGRLTTPARYQLQLSSVQDSGISARCVVISPTGQPSIRTDSNHDGNCING